MREEEKEEREKEEENGEKNGWVLSERGWGWGGGWLIWGMGGRGAVRSNEKDFIKL